jgi:hypothetical protein
MIVKQMAFNYIMSRVKIEVEYLYTMIINN